MNPILAQRNIETPQDRISWLAKFVIKYIDFDVFQRSNDGTDNNEWGFDINWSAIKAAKYDFQSYSIVDQFSMNQLLKIQDEKISKYQFGSLSRNDIINAIKKYNIEYVNIIYYSIDDQNETMYFHDEYGKVLYFESINNVIIICWSIYHYSM